MIQNPVPKLVLIPALIGILALSISSIAGASLWQVRAFAAWAEPDLDFNLPNNDDTDIHASANGSLGLGVSFENQFSDRLGLELGVLRASPEIVLDYYLNELDSTLTTSDRMAMTAFTLGLNIHLLPKNRLDLYLAPVVAYVLNSDLEFTINQSFEVGDQIILIQDSTRVEVASDVAYGATLGLDIPFSSRPWAVATSLRYLASELDATDEDGDSSRPDFNSWIFTVGLRYSF